MTEDKPAAIHITTIDGAVVRDDFKDRQAARRFARRLTRNGPPVILVDPVRGSSDLYVDGRQSREGLLGRRSDEAELVSAPVGCLAGENLPDWTQFVEALGDRTRAVPASNFDAAASDARRCGIYAWWADEEAGRLIAEALGTEVSPLTYIGKAEDTLASRVCAHLRAKIWSSTLRKSLTAILMTDRAVARRYPDLDGRAWLDELTDWMREHLEVAVFPIEKRRLKQAERAALTRYDPPLNQQDAPTSSAELTRLRKLVDQRR